MIYNFSPIDASQGINWHTNQWNNIGNAIKSGADALDSFGKQKQQWDLMKQQEQEAAAKKAQFNNNISNIRNQMANDQKINGLQQNVNQANQALQTAQTNLDNKVNQQVDSSLDDWNIDSQTGSVTPAELPELDDVDTSAETEALNQANQNLQDAQSQYDEAGLLSGYAKYLNDPMFELALQQAEQTQSYEPIIGYINNFNADEYRRERDRIVDELQEKMLGKEAYAAAKEAQSAKLTYKLDSELSALDGLNFGKDGRVKVGPYAGKSMEDLISEVASRYKGVMGEKDFWNAVMNHKTMAQYQKMMATRGSTIPQKRKRRL